MVLAAVLAVLLLLLYLPVGTEVFYDETGPRLKLLAGPVKILLYPRKKKKHPKKKKPEPPSVKEEEPLKEKTRFTLQDLSSFLHLLTELTRKLKKKLVIERLELHVAVGGKDAASAALGYGRAWAAIGAVTPVLENNFKIKKRDIQAFCNYTEEKTQFRLLFRVRMRVGQMMALGIWAGVGFLKIILEKKRRCRNESSST